MTTPEMKTQPTVADPKPLTKKRVAPKKSAKRPAAKPLKSTPKKSQKTDSKSKPKKPKLVRDSFTIPENEYKILSEKKKALLKNGVEAKKTELVRVGLALVGEASIPELKRQLSALAKLKSGRPKNS